MFRSTLLAAPLALALAPMALAQDPAPVIAVIAHPVADFDTWRAAYDKLLPLRQAAGLIDAQVLRAPNDPNMVILVHEFETLEGAQALFASPELKKEMQSAGVTAPPTIIIGVNAQ
jgi:hypothetical protein